MPPENKLVFFLHSNYDRFTPSQKRIARYITQNFDECTFHTIDELAKRCGVNPSTLLRFCRDIGFSGYPQFQKALQKNLMDRLNYAEHSDYLSRPMLAILNEKGNSEPAVKALQAEIKCIKELAANLDIERIQKFSKHIIKARRRYCLASKGSFGVGHILYYRLKNIISDTFFLTDSDGGMYDNLIDIKPDDVLIAINGPRYTSRTVKYAQYVYEKKLCPILSITDCQESPLYMISEVSLFYPSASYSFLRSNIGRLALITCILAEVSSHDVESNIKRLESYEEVFDYFNLIY